MNNHQNVEANLKPYYIRFGIVLLVLYIIIAVLRYVFSLDSTIGLTVVLPLIAAQFVAETFIKKQRRVPTGLEINRLSLGCTLIIVLINLPLAALGILAGAFDQDFSPTLMLIVAGLLLAMLVANYFMIRWAFDGVAKKRAKKLGIGAAGEEA